MTDVTAVPSSIPLIGVFVIRYRNDSSLSPATLFRPSPISAMPYMNNATPHRRDNIMAITFKTLLSLPFAPGLQLRPVISVFAAPHTGKCINDFT